MACQIIIGTPAEMASIRKLRCFDTNQIVLVAFDDADSVVTTDLVVNNLIKPLPPACQLLLFSATINKAARQFVRDPLYLKSSNEEISESIKHAFIECANDQRKFETLVEICDALKSGNHINRSQIIVFTNVSVLI